MDATTLFANKKVVVIPPLHKHYFSLQLSNGVIIGVCKCGAAITHREILARINTE